MPNFDAGLMEHAFQYLMGEVHRPHVLDEILGVFHTRTLSAVTENATSAVGQNTVRWVGWKTDEGLASGAVERSATQETRFSCWRILRATRCRDNGNFRTSARVLITERENFLEKVREENQEYNKIVVKDQKSPFSKITSSLLHDIASQAVKQQFRKVIGLQQTDAEALSEAILTYFEENGIDGKNDNVYIGWCKRNAWMAKWDSREN
uniref:Uncharacterized protein n=1 Tax=Romanomermis culicivorax TaxID=13658 RepID=A0A915IHE9_ROMCU